MSDLYLPDTPEGRAVDQVVKALSDRSEPGQLGATRKLMRIGAEAMAKLVGADEAASFAIQLSRDLLKGRGNGHGAKRVDR